MSWWSRLFGDKSDGELKPNRLDYLSEALTLERQGGYPPAVTSNARRRAPTTSDGSSTPGRRSSRCATSINQPRTRNPDGQGARGRQSKGGRGKNDDRGKHCRGARAAGRQDAADRCRPSGVCSLRTRIACPGRPRWIV